MVVLVLCSAISRRRLAGPFLECAIELLQGLKTDCECDFIITRHTTEGRANPSLSFHSFRHSFNSAMANAGVSQEIRQKLTGHASAEMNTIYTHHELEPLRDAIARIPAIVM